MPPGIRHLLALICPVTMLAAGCGERAGPCDNCTITLTELATLRMPADSAGFLTSSRPVRDGRGRYIVAPIAEQGRIAVFDSAGRFLQTVGSQGRGPGQFARIDLIAVIPGDSLLVFDRPNARMSVLDSAFRVARTVRFAGQPFGAVRIRSGALVVSAAFVDETQSTSGSPFHVIDDSGRVRSFGGPTDTARREFPDVRAIAASRAGGFWSAPLNEYRIDHADLVETPRPALAVGVPWFPVWQKPDAGPPWVVRPQPKFTAIREDSAGRLWTLLMVPHAQWRPLGAQSFRDDGPMSTPSLAASDSILQRVIEVIDPKTGHGIATRRVAFSFFGFADDDAVYRARETPDGEIELVVFRLGVE